MPTWMRDSGKGLSALLFSALLLTPAVGCGPDETETPTPDEGTPTAAPTPTATGGTGATAAFPDGSFLFRSVYNFTFRTVPYVLTMSGYADGTDRTGNMTGEMIWILWESEDSEANSETPDCVMYETMTGTDHTEGSLSELDYSTCIFCNPYSDAYSVYDHDDGCSEELFDWWYLNTDTGEYDYDFSNVFGYRHAESDGWPTEFSSIADSLTANGWSGALYDLLLAGTSFDAVYIVGELSDEAAKPEIARAKAIDPKAIDHSMVKTIMLDGPADVRAFLNSHPVN